MLTKEEMRARYKKLNLNGYEVPNGETTQRMLDLRWPAAFKDRKEFSKLDKIFFEYCHTQVGPFGGGTYNAIEISHLTGLPAIWIASYISTYGVDWPAKAYSHLYASRRHVDEYNIIDKAFGHIVTPRTMHHTMEFPLATMRNEIQNGTLKEYLASKVKGAAGFQGTRYAALEPMDLGLRDRPKKDDRYTVKPPRKDLLDLPQEGDLI